MAVVTSGDSVCIESRTDRLQFRVEVLRPVHEGPGPLGGVVCLLRVAITVDTWALGGAVPRFMAVVFRRRQGAGERAYATSQR